MTTTGTNEKTDRNTGSLTQGFNRFVPSLDTTEMAEFAEMLSVSFSRTISLDEVERAHERIANFVANMRGRVGEGMFDLLLLYFSRRIAAEAFIEGASGENSSEFRSFEIGTLFGGSTVVSSMAIEDLDIKMRQVVIDPLSGYYGQGVDPVTGLPVVKENVIENFRIAKLPLSGIEILPGLSEDPEIIERATKGRFVSGFIDGDHSYAGIHRDWFNYTPHIEVGGLVIVDNYNDKTAPEVSVFIDGIVLPYLRDYYETVLETAQTIVFRKTAEVPDALNTQLSEHIPFNAAVRNMDKLRNLASAQQHSAEERGRALENRTARVNALAGNISELQAELVEARQAGEAASAKVAQQEVEIASLAERNDAFKRREAKAQSRLADVTDNLERATRRVENLTAAVSEKREVAAVLEERNGRLAEELEEALAHTAALDDRLAESESQVDELTLSAVAKEERVLALQKDRKSAVAKMTALERKLQRIDGEREKNALDLVRANADLTMLKTEHDDAKRLAAESQAELHSLQEASAALKQELAGREQDLATWQQKYQESAREIDEANTALAAESERAVKAEKGQADQYRKVSTLKESLASIRLQAAENASNLSGQLKEAHDRAAASAKLAATSQAEIAKLQAQLAQASRAGEKAEKLQRAGQRKAQDAEQLAARAQADLRAERKRNSQQERELHVLEAQLEAPRILLSRLVRSTASRIRRRLSRSIAAKPEPKLLDTPKQASSAAAPVKTRTKAVAKIHKPIGVEIPPTPEMHDAGPPQHDQTLFVNYTFGGKTRYLQRHDFLRQTLRAGRALDKLKGTFKGQRCFVIGNGPSLNHQNLPQLKSEFTIGSNYIYMNKEKMGFYPTIIAFANYLVIKQRMDEIMGLDQTVKALPFYLFDDLGAPENSMVINMQHQTPNFSGDASSYVSTQSTVTYVNLQLAHYLGFDKVYLIGVDNRYIQPDHGKEGTVLTQKEDDPNHFTPNYFKGLKWQKGDEEKMESLYVRAKAAFEARGSEVIDCTYNGALTVFPKQDLDEVIAKTPAPPKALVGKAVSTLRQVTSPKPNDQLTPKHVVVAISPDLEDRFGHHFNMDRYLRSIARDKGDELISLCSSKLDPQLRDENNWLMPAFNNRTWYSLRDEKVIRRKTKSFTEDLKRAMAVVERAFEPGTKFSLYMYTGNLPLAKAVAEFAQTRPNYKVDLHHFYGAIVDMENPEIAAESRELIGDILGAGAKLYLGTDELVDYYEKKTGHRLGYLGDPSVTFSDDEVKAMIAASKDAPRDFSTSPAKVFFPPNMNVEKGYLTALAAARKIAETPKLSKQLTPTLRFVPRDSTPDEIVDEATALKGHPRANFVEGVLTDAEFQAITLDADIIAIPYTRKAFDRRMSGSLTDALVTAKPIVATRGTYVGNQIERFGCGEVFEDGDSEGLVAALERVRANYATYKQAALKARQEYFRERSWGSLYKRVIQGK